MERRYAIQCAVPIAGMLFLGINMVQYDRAVQKHERLVAANKIKGVNERLRKILLIDDIVNRENSWNIGLSSIADYSPYYSTHDLSLRDERISRLYLSNRHLRELRKKGDLVHVSELKSQSPERQQADRAYRNDFSLAHQASREPLPTLQYIPEKLEEYSGAPLVEHPVAKPEWFIFKGNIIEAVAPDDSEHTGWAEGIRGVAGHIPLPKKSVAPGNTPS